MPKSARQAPPNTPKKTPKRSKPPDPTAKPARALLKAQSLLILHLDANKLRDDGLHLGEVAQWGAFTSAIGTGAETTVEDATDESDLLKKLADFVLRKKTFDVIVVIGHSHAGGIRMASDHGGVTNWPAFAKYLKCFRPRRLLLVACKAGRWDAGEALFKEISSLRRIYACPVNASKDFGALMLFAVPYVVANRLPKDKFIISAQIAAIALTGRQLREWRRTSDKGNTDSAVFDAIADLIDPFLRHIPAALRNILR